MTLCGVTHVTSEKIAQTFVPLLQIQHAGKFSPQCTIICILTPSDWFSLHFQKWLKNHCRKEAQWSERHVIYWISCVVSELESFRTHSLTVCSQQFDCDCCGIWGSVCAESKFWRFLMSPMIALVYISFRQRCWMESCSIPVEFNHL